MLNTLLKKFISAAALLMSMPLVANAGDYVRYTTINQPRQECWNERVAVNYGHNEGAIIGGIAGGILGNQVGNGNGRVVATAAGALTGAIVGERLSNSNRSTGYQTVQRCRTVYDQVRVPVASYEVEPVRNVVYVEEREEYRQRRHHRYDRHDRHHRYDRHHRHHHDRHCGHVTVEYRDQGRHHRDY